MLRNATNASAQVVVKGVRRIWRAEATDTGLSAKSVTKKIVAKEAGFTAVIGIDATAVGVSSDGTRHVPSNIDHLIEFGFVHRSGRQVPAVAPLRRGFESSRHAAARVFELKVKKEIEKEATRR